MKKTTVKYPYLTQDVEIYERENGHKIVLAHKEGELVNVSTWVKQVLSMKMIPITEFHTS